MPFKIHIPDEALKDLRERLLRARLPEPLEGVGWSYGTEYKYLKASGYGSVHRQEARMERHVEVFTERLMYITNCT